MTTLASDSPASPPPASTFWQRMRRWYTAPRPQYAYTTWRSNTLWGTGCLTVAAAAPHLKLVSYPFLLTAELLRKAGPPPAYHALMSNSPPETDLPVAAASVAPPPAAPVAEAAPTAATAPPPPTEIATAVDAMTGALPPICTSALEGFKAAETALTDTATGCQISAVVGNLALAATTASEALAHVTAGLAHYQTLANKWAAAKAGRVADAFFGPNNEPVKSALTALQRTLTELANTAAEVPAVTAAALTSHVSEAALSAQTELTPAILMALACGTTVVARPLQTAIQGAIASLPRRTPTPRPATAWYTLPHSNHPIQPVALSSGMR